MSSRQLTSSQFDKNPKKPLDNLSTIARKEKCWDVQLQVGVRWWYFWEILILNINVHLITLGYLSPHLVMGLFEFVLTWNDSFICTIMTLRPMCSPTICWLKKRLYTASIVKGDQAKLMRYDCLSNKLWNKFKYHLSNTKWINQ